MVITRQERQEWAHHPVTQEWLEQLQESKAETMEAWAAEAFVGATPEATQSFNATALGGVRVLKQLIEEIESLKRTEGEE